LKQRRKAYLLLALIWAVIPSCLNKYDGPDSPASLIHIGDPIPEFVLTSADGKDFSSSALDGQAYILNFFDTGCPDCREELRVLQRIHNAYGDVVPVLNVPRSQSEDAIRAYWKEAGFSMPYYIPHDKDLYYQFANRTIPRTYLVDADGNLYAEFSDNPPADFETLDNLLGKLVEKNNVVSMSVRVKVPALNVVDEYYFHNEYTISRLDMYLFDAETKQFYSRVSITDFSPEESTIDDPRYDVTYVYNDIKIRAGVYDIFTITNYENAPEEVNSECDFLNMIDEITFREGIEANIPDSGPVMTNRATSLLSVDLVPWINKKYVLGVEVERVMAKLQIGVAQNSFQLVHKNRKYADINITNYKLVNLNQQYYLFQHKAEMTQFGPAPQFVMPDNFTEYEDRGNQYVVDPLFYLKTPDSVDSYLWSNYYKTWFGEFTTADFASMPSAENYGYAYVLENTAFKTSQKNGYSPGIVFKAAVSPVFVYLYDYSLSGLKEEYRPEYWPKTIYLYNYNFYGSIQAINVAAGLALDEMETYTDAQLKAYGIKQSHFNMGVYETYYTYWIQHRKGEDPLGPMQYGIVRNNFYRMVVKGVNGLGDSSIRPVVLRDNYPNSYQDVEVN